MPHPRRRAAFITLALASLSALLAAAWLPAGAGAAAVTPQSGTTCYGSLKHDPTGASQEEPNLLDYKFLCDSTIVAYSIVVNRGAGRPETIDDFDPGPLVTQPDGSPSTTQSPGCSGTIPGNGFNCNIGTGAQITDFNTVSGSFDLIDAYCAHYPPGAKGGTLREPQAQVQLIVTNFSGAQDGPFPLGLKPGCPWLKPLKPKPASKHKRKGPSKHKSKHTAAATGHNIAHVQKIN
jgi:hypothetical protein